MSSNLKIFLTYIVVALTLGYATELLLVSEDIVIDHYQNQVSNDILYKILDFRQKWNWVGYALLPLISIIKFSLISLCIYAGVYLLEYPIRLSRIFRVIVIAEFIFLVPVTIKLVWFGFIQTDYSLTDLQYFMPLSMLQIFDPLHLQSWLIYPFSILSIFELAYWVVLSLLLGRELNQHFDNMFRLVSSTYGVGLFLWLVVVIFVSVSLT